MDDEHVLMLPMMVSGFVVFWMSLMALAQAMLPANQKRVKRAVDPKSCERDDDHEYVS